MLKEDKGITISAKQKISPEGGKLTRINCIWRKKQTVTAQYRHEVYASMKSRHSLNDAGLNEVQETGTNTADHDRGTNRNMSDFDNL
ncbi:hypothetical protein EVAR_4652_1 [Eumeta japonica]|uniref:Uncharacterized protein n=1 Tax=Eumeta variegata TaxID=151549 RepID=A0A4C1Y9Z5_EUMVA|nr:hypothetical protein EVAR_4652_1 [Eumeta japonica]